MAGFCGVFLGFLGWSSTALGALAAFLLAAVVSAARLARTTEARDGTLAFAPYIFAGALVAIIVN